jgi:hypothetical protein
MTDQLKFPIHPTHRKLLEAVPWEIVAPHERQADRNHGQTLRRLAERGGLSLCELAAVLEDRKYRKMSTEEALAVVLQFMRQPEGGDAG